MNLQTKSSFIAVLLLVPAIFFTLSPRADLRADQPFFETTVVYPMSPDNRPNYRIPAIIQAPNKDLLIFTEKRNDGIGDIGNHDLVVIRSKDKGKTWGGETVIFDDDLRTCTDSTVVVDRDTGKIFLFFLRDKKKYYYTASQDNGQTWTVPVSIHSQVTKPEWDSLEGSTPQVDDAKLPSDYRTRVKLWEEGWHQRYGVGPGAGAIQLRWGPKRGRILVPARHKEEVGNGKDATFSHVFYSDDHGKSWKLGGTAAMYGNECQLIELTNGQVMLNMRDGDPEHSPDNFRRRIAVSSDGGETWARNYRDETLIEPQVNASIVRYSTEAEHGRNRMLFSNPASSFREKLHPYGRYNLTVRISYDEAQSWTTGRTIYVHPCSYSSLVVLDDMTIGIVYERGPKGSDHYWDEIHFARFNLEWLSYGKDALKKR